MQTARQITNFLVAALLGASLTYAYLAPKIECAYHEGSDEGYNTARSEIRHESCEEDEPCWDCTTMGNRICGSD